MWGGSSNHIFDRLIACSRGAHFWPCLFGSLAQAGKHESTDEETGGDDVEAQLTAHRTPPSCQSSRKNNSKINERQDAGCTLYGANYLPEKSEASHAVMLEPNIKVRGLRHEGTPHHTTGHGSPDPRRSFIYKATFAHSSTDLFVLFY